MFYSFAINQDVQTYQPSGSINYSRIDTVELNLWRIRQCMMSGSYDRKRIDYMSCPALVANKVFIGDRDLIDRIRQLENEIEHARVEIQALYDELEPMMYMNADTSTSRAWVLLVAIVIFIAICALFR
jgi:hypothetical protein